MNQPPNPSVLGRYQLLDCRQEGPLGRLFDALDTASGQKALVRVLDPLAASNTRLREAVEDLADANSPRRIQDPAVLRILDAGKDGAHCFVVFEAFDGKPLDEFLKARPIPLGDKLRLAALAAESLRAVHAHRVVHGDVKPANILVSEGSRGRLLLKLAPADLAQSAADACVSVFGEIVGTPKYLAPEQLSGRPATPASDIFALGVVFYEMFSGAEPFPASGPLGYLRSNAEAPLRPLSQADASLPATLERVVARMLARDPQQRYRSAQAVVDEIERVEASLAGGRIEPPPMGTDSAFAPSLALAGGNVAAWRTVALTSLAAAAVLLVAVVILTFRTSPPSLSGSVATEGELPPSAAPAASRPADSPQGRAAAGGRIIIRESFSEVREEARRLAQLGQYSDALRTLDDFRRERASVSDALAAEKEMVAVRFMEAEALLERGQLDAAEALFRRIAQEKFGAEWEKPCAERLAQAQVRRARGHEQRAELAQAVKAMERVIAEYPETAAANEARRDLPGLKVRLANALAGASPEKAIGVLQGVSPADAPEAAKSQGQALLARAEKGLEAGRLTQALSDFREAYKVDPALSLQAKPREAEVLARIALDHQANGRPGEAVTTWNELEKKFPNSLAAQRHRPSIERLLAIAGKAGLGDNAALLAALADQARESKDEAGWRRHMEQAATNFPDTKAGKAAAKALAEADLAAALDLVGRGEREKGVSALKAVASKWLGSDAAQRAQQELDRFSKTPEGMVYVPGGSFVFGLSDAAMKQVIEKFNVPLLMAPLWLGPQVPDQVVRLKGFYMDRHEVTNAEYKAFVDATGHAPPPSSDWTEKNIKPGMESNPVTQVSWEDARAYAQWAGKRLPTEREWEKAARGPDGRLWPWGSNFDPKRAVLSVAGFGAVRPVGSIPDGRSPYGCYDMIGNVLEWTAGEYGPYEGRQPEGVVFERGMRVARGAGFDEAAPYFCLCTSREPLPPDTRSASLGFRCAKDAE